jgi:hypothetical protein
VFFPTKLVDDRYNILFKIVDINIFRGKRGRRYHRRKNSDDGLSFFFKDNIEEDIDILLKKKVMNSGVCP